MRLTLTELLLSFTKGDPRQSRIKSITRWSPRGRHKTQKFRGTLCGGAIENLVNLWISIAIYEE
jgi:hypothetical protein